MSLLSHRFGSEVAEATRECFAVLATTRARSIAVTSLLARLPKGLVPLAVVYHLHELTGGYGLAGLVVAAIAVGDAVTAPLQGRWIDRAGRGRILIGLSLFYGGALVALAFLSPEMRPWMLVASGLLIGVGFPPVSASVKSVWSEAAASRLAAAYRVESLLQQILFLTGPLWLAVLLLWARPAWALVVAAGCTVVGAIGFVAAASPYRARPGDRLGGGAVRVPAVRALTLATFVQGLAFGALPVMLPAVGTAAGHPRAGASLQAILSGGGLLGTIAPAGVDQRVRRRYVLLIAGFAVALLPLAVPGLTSSMGGLIAAGAGLLVAGLYLTPIAAMSYLIISWTAGPGQRTEAFAWLSSAQACGTAAGSAIAGVAVDQVGLTAGLLLPAAAAATAALLARLLLPPGTNPHTVDKVVRCGFRPSGRR